MNELVHLAIIMDGNGRWAKRQGKERSFGHQEGAKKVREITEYASSMGVKYLSLYAFSTENWNRPKSEVAILMKLLSRFLKSEVPTLKANNIRFTTIGDNSKLSASLQKEIEKAKQETSTCTGMTQVLAINYGSQDEIVRAANVALTKGKALTKELIEEHLDTAGIPSVDLLIRTGGETRISNFLLWQAAYSELYFSDKLWPEFDHAALMEAIADFNRRERRFGKTSEQLSS